MNEFNHKRNHNKEKYNRGTQIGNKEMRKSKRQNTVQNKTKQKTKKKKKKKHLRPENGNDDLRKSKAQSTIQNNSEDEEFSTEFTADDSMINSEFKEDVDNQATNVMGWAAVILSVLSLFFMPILFGGAGIIVGFISRNREAEWLGN